MSKPFETFTNEEKQKLAALLAAAETQDEHPPWYNGKRIDEVAYCESLLAEQELRCHGLPAKIAPRLTMLHTYLLI